MIKFLQRLWVFLLLLTVQVLILNHVQIVGYATPYLYIYYILILNSETPRNSLLLQAFGLGLCVDIFSNTPGMNAAAATLMALARTPVLHSQMSRDITDDFEPNIRNLGFFHFLRYALYETIVFIVALQALNAFSVFRGKELFLRIVTDVVITVFLIVCVDVLRKRRKR